MRGEVFDFHRTVGRAIGRGVVSIPAASIVENSVAPPQSSSPDRGLNLTDSTILSLCDLLLTDDLPTRRQLAAELLAQDNGLAAWARNNSGKENPADWLPENGFEKLAAEPASTTINITSQEPHRACPPAIGLLARLLAQRRRLAALEFNFQKTLQREKLAAMKELAYGAGHEINNPLTNIATRAQTLLAGERDAERRRQLATINAQAFRAFEMIADLMLFAKPPTPVWGRVDLGALIDTLISSLGEKAAEQATTLIHARPTGPWEITADATQITVALRALCQNSLEALGKGGRVELGLLRPAHGWAEITVADNGPGIAPEAQRHLFDPFYSGRESGRGLGLGLCKCWRIVQLHQGEILVASRAGDGAKFIVRLPTELVGVATSER